VSNPRTAPDQPQPLAGWRWWTGLTVGGAVGLFGLAGLLADAAQTMPLVWLAWLVGLLLVHDLVLAPLVQLAGRRLRDKAPEAWRWPLQLGLVTSGVLVLASVPVLVGVGRRTQPHNASVLPGDYPLALAGVLAVVWLVVLALRIWGVARHRLAGRPLGDDTEESPKEVLFMGEARSAHPPVVRVSGRARAELRAGEALVFDWTRLAFCCAVAGEVSLRPTTLQEAQRPSVYVPLWSGDGPLVVAHRRAYPMLVGRDIEVDCRRRLGVRWFSSSLPPDLGLRTSFGRETGHGPGDRREGPAWGADAPLS
jgi:hypothetical protein